MRICLKNIFLFSFIFLGVILYTLLHGRQPFNIDSKSIVNDIVAGKYEVTLHIYTEKKKKFSVKDFFSKCDKIRSFLGIWSHSLKQSLMENFIFCAVLEKVIV